MFTHRIAALAFSFAALIVCNYASAQDAETAWREAFYALEEHAPDIAVPLLRQAAERGHLAAQRTLGFVLIYGEGMYGPLAKAQPEAGMSWLRIAAARGDATARVMVEHLERPLPARLARR